MPRAKKIMPRTDLSLYAAIAVLITANAALASQGRKDSIL